MELFQQALTIMALGMGLVFVFLALVILLVQAISKVIQQREQSSPALEQTSPVNLENEIIAVAIAAALHEHR